MGNTLHVFGKKKEKNTTMNLSLNNLFYQVASKNVKQPKSSEPGTFQDCEMVSAPSLFTKCPLGESLQTSSAASKTVFNQAT